MKNYLLYGISCLALCFFASSCAEGFDDNERFQSDVTNAQLESPKLEKSSFATVSSASGDQVKVTWDVVKGAIGYEVQVAVVDDPSHPQVLVNEVVDGCSVSFEKLEDTNYSVSVRTLGNPALNNKDAQAATVYAYSTMIEAKKIPAGIDIADFVAQNLNLAAEDEQAFELEAGATYEVSKLIEFRNKKVTFRGNKVNRPIVVFKNESYIATAGGLTVKYINFDCTEMKPDKGYAPVTLAEEQYPELLYVSTNGSENYLLADPIIYKSCNFKNVRSALFSTGKNAFAVRQLIIDDVIAQLDNAYSGDGADVITAYMGSYTYVGESQVWRGSIQSISITNSTLYNIQENTQGRFVRFANNTMKRHFDTDQGWFTMKNCTLIRTSSNKEFANNTPNNNLYTIDFNNNICYDVFRLQKFIQGNCTKTVDMTTNTIWGVKNSVDSTDKSKWATEEDANFVCGWEGTKQVLDITDSAKGGLNFKPQGAISSRIGDPRWLK